MKYALILVGLLAGQAICDPRPAQASQQPIVPKISMTAYAGRECRGEIEARVHDSNTCTFVSNTASLYVNRFPSDCQLHAYTSTDCSGDYVVLDTGGMGDLGCFNKDIESVEVVCTNGGSNAAVETRDIAVRNLSSDSTATAVDVAPMENATLHTDVVFTWGVAVALFNFVNYGFSLFGVYEACLAENQQGGSINGITCVTGAIATVFTFAGTASSVFKKTSKIFGQIATAGLIVTSNRRSIESFGYASITDAYEDTARNISAKLGVPYTFDSMIYANDTRLGNLVPEGSDFWPVFKVTNPRNQTFHHTFYEHSSGILLHRLGFITDLAKRESYYNDERFNSASLDFSACHNNNAPDDLVVGDWQNMDDEASCLLGNYAKVSAIEYTIFDDTVGVGIATGDVAPVDATGKTYLRSLPQCPSPSGGKTCQTYQS